MQYTSSFIRILIGVLVLLTIFAILSWTVIFAVPLIFLIAVLALTLYFQKSNVKIARVLFAVSLVGLVVFIWYVYDRLGPGSPAGIPASEYPVRKDNYTQ